MSDCGCNNNNSNIYMDDGMNSMNPMDYMGNNSYSSFNNNSNNGNNANNNGNPNDNNNGNNNGNNGYNNGQNNGHINSVNELLNSLNVNNNNNNTNNNNNNNNNMNNNTMNIPVKKPLNIVDNPLDVRSNPIMNNKELEKKDEIIKTLAKVIKVQKDNVQLSDPEKPKEETKIKLILLGVMISMGVLCALSWHDTIKYFINRAIKFDEGKPLYFVYYTVAMTLFTIFVFMKVRTLV